MRVMSKYLWVLAAVLLCSCTADRSNDLAGDWLTVTSEPGARPNLITFKRQGGSWTGVIKSTFGSMEMQDVTVQGERVSFKLALGPGGSLPASGALEAGELHLAMPSPNGVADSVARRASNREVAALEAAEPKKLPLPSLHDVPANGLARTPPLGWNSWYKFGAKIDDQTVREVADAMVSSGLRDAGFVYVNIDDGWEGERDAQGMLHPNSKFPDMKALGEYIHGRGLKFGIYSSPGPYTCGGYEGSHGHEEQDARTFAEWGVDYLKHDWCAARRFYQTQQEMQALYQKMGDALQATGRPIVYALCQYGMFDVGKWGLKVGANLWRTTFDMRDEWKAMTDIGFSQDGREADAGPGAWNDPDMLQAGLGGMSPDEYRTQVTLWSILAAPLLLGHDPRHMTPEIKALLTNREVIAIDQDPLGKQGHRLLQRGEAEVWARPLSDGATAVALFNRGAMPANLEVRWSELGLSKVSAVRDLWQQRNLGPQRERYRAVLPPHGTVLLRVASNQGL